MTPEESMKYRISLRQKAGRLTQEEKEWLYCHPAYSQRYGTNYLQQDIIELEPDTLYRLKLSCLYLHDSYPIVPILFIPECHKGYVQFDPTPYPGLFAEKQKKSVHLNIRLGTEHPAWFFFCSNGGLLGVEYGCFIPAENQMSRWWESIAFPDLAMKAERLQDNLIQYSCKAGGRRPELMDAPPAFDKYVFTIEWEKLGE